MSKSTYMTTFKGDVSLESLSTNQCDIVSKTVNEVFPELMNFDKQSRILYISGEYDNTTHKVQTFFLKLAPAFPKEYESTIKAQGKDIKDRWDLIIRLKSVYIQEYSLVPDKIRLYKE